MDSVYIGNLVFYPSISVIWIFLTDKTILWCSKAAALYALDVGCFSFVCYKTFFSPKSTGRDFKPPALSICFFSLHLTLVSCLRGLFSCTRMAIWVSLETEGDYGPLFSWLGSKATLKVGGGRVCGNIRSDSQCAEGRNRSVGNTLVLWNNRNLASFSVWHVIATTCYSVLLCFWLVRGHETSVGTWCFVDMTT